MLSPMKFEPLKRDKRWEIFYGDISIEDFVEKKLPRFYFKDEVDQEIKDSFKIVFKILTHAYFEYAFLDVAVTKALHILELGLKIRYRELNNGNEWDEKKPLKSLLNWFHERHYFESNNPDFLNHVREMRNLLSHPTHNNLAGTVGLPWISTVMDIINGLYEDIELRVKRWESTKEYKTKFEAFLKDGAKLKLMEDTILIYRCGQVIVDNRKEPALCYFSLLPLFDVASSTPKKSYIFSYRADWLTFENDTIDLSMGTNKIALSSALDSSEFETINKFKSLLADNMDYKVQQLMLLFDAENTIRESIRKSTISL
jgi:hypothetical protein